MKRKFDTFLVDILQEIKIINNATKSLTFEQFKNDQILVRAAIRSFEIMGEAVSCLPDDIKEKYDYIP